MFLGLHILISVFAFGLVALCLLVWRKHNLFYEIAIVVLGAVGLSVLAVSSVEKSASEKANGISADLMKKANILAKRTEKLGHATISTGATTHSENFDRILGAQERWQDSDPSYQAVYTVRQTGNHQFKFIASSTADYNQDGVISGEREQAVENGYVYEDYPVEFEQAVESGKPVCTAPYKDQWGEWVTVVEPMWTPTGKLDALLAVDFSAENWESDLNRARWETTIVFMIASFLYLSLAVGLLHAMSSSRECKMEVESLDRATSDGSLNYSEPVENSETAA